MMREGRVTTALAVLVAAGAVACTDLESPVDLAPDSIWEASISPGAGGVPDPDAPIVTGQAAAVVQNGRTEVGIQLNGLQDDAHWGLFEGSCRQPGAMIGSADDYPTLSPDDPSAEAIVDTELSRTGSYNVRVSSDAGGSPAIACGELVLRDDV